VLNVRATRLGKVQHATFQIAPLTILVGKNKTGKSYVATLIWALGNLSLLAGVGRRAARPKWLSEFLKPIVNSERRTQTIDPAEAEKIFKSVAREIDRKAGDFLGRVFSFKGFESTNLTFFKDDYPTIVLELIPDSISDDADRDNSSVRVVARVEGKRINCFVYPAFIFSEMNSWVADQVYYDLAGIILFGGDWQKVRYPLYIPAARTGLMLALPDMVDSSLGIPGSKRRELPIPLSQFLRRMARSGDLYARESKVRDVLIERLMSGKLIEQKGAVREFRYEPHGASVRLPLHAVSSMITELAPLVVALGDDPEFMHLVFEEPEAHLHLEAQREMARLIARLLK